MRKDKSMNASNSRADNRKKTPETAWNRARSWAPVTVATSEKHLQKHGCQQQHELWKEHGCQLLEDQQQKIKERSSGALVDHLVCNLKVEGCSQPVLIYLTGTPPENSYGPVNAAVQ
jgi:hypothetical protein